MHSEKICEAGDVYIRTCRACLKPSDCERNLQLDQDDWLEMYNFCINPEITDNAMVQTMVFCKNCSRLLRKFSEFKKQCLTSENFWKALTYSELAISVSKTKPNNVSPNIEPKLNVKRNKNKSMIKEEKHEKEESDTDNYGDETVFIVLDDDKVENFEEEMPLEDDNWSNASDNAFKEENENPKSDIKSFKGSCDTCGKEFRMRNCLIKHVQKCERRKKQTVQRDQICKHDRDSDKCELCKILRTHSNSPGNCENCGKFYSKKYYLDRHVEFCVNKIEDVKFCGLCVHEPEDDDWDERNHLLQHYKNNDLRCQICDFVGPDFAKMISHRYLHHPSREISLDSIYYLRSCVLCRKTAQTPRLAEFHFRKVHIGGKGGWCGVCDKRFLTVKRWKYHRHDDDNNALVSQCPECKKIVRDIHHLRVHIKAMHMPDRFVCESCGVAFTSERNLSDHIKIVHSDHDPVKCDHCGLMYKNMRSLHKHKRLMIQEKKVPCKYCPKKFQNHSTLASHMFSHSDERQVFCNVCKKGFKNRRGMLSHVKYVHSGIKPYKCSICEKCCSTSTALASHMFSHSDERQVFCNYCKKSFKNRSYMLLHVKNVHLGIKPYKCSICEKCCSTSTALASHMFSHSDERQVLCNYCKKSFKNRSAMMIHVKYLHLGIKPFQCSICDKCFPTSNALARHMPVHTRA